MKFKDEYEKLLLFVYIIITCTTLISITLGYCMGLYKKTKDIKTELKEECQHAPSPINLNGEILLVRYYPINELNGN